MRSPERGGPTGSPAATSSTSTSSASDAASPLGLVIRTVRSRGYLLEQGRFEAATGT